MLNQKTLRGIVMSDEADYAGSSYGPFIVEIATSGQEALQKVESFEPDLILLDIIMPGLNGFDVLVRLKKSSRTESIPVIIITGLTDEENEELGLKLGAVDYIAKPFKKTIVLARINIHRKIVEQMRQIESYSLFDPLTGIMNRRSFDHNAELVWGLTTRQKEPVSIMVIDVDNFKMFNDKYGHQHGDLALKTVAYAIKKTLKRETDMVFRWGGEEFTVLLPNTAIEGALHVSERIMKSIRNAAIPGLDGVSLTSVTASIGVATTVPTADKAIADLIRQADKAVYKAKESGKNRTCVWT